MDLHEWKREHRKNLKVNPIIFDFLDELPGVFEYLSNDEWTNIGYALNMLPSNKKLRIGAFKLYCHTLMTMDCFNKYPTISKGLIRFLRSALVIDSSGDDIITRDNLIDLKIALNSSHDVIDFLDNL